MHNSEHNFRTISLISEAMKMIQLDGKLLRQRTRQLAQKIRFSLWRMVVVADVSLKEYQQLHPKYNLQCQQIDRRPHFPPKFSPRFLRCLTKTFFVSSRDKCIVCLKRRSVATNTVAVCFECRIWRLAAVFRIVSLARCFPYPYRLLLGLRERVRLCFHSFSKFKLQQTGTLPCFMKQYFIVYFD